MSNSKARMQSAIEILTLQALAYDAIGDRLKAQRALAGLEGYVRMFVGERTPLAALLRELRAHGAMPTYGDKLLAAFPDEEPRTNDEST
jgi:hypothetical protein